MKAVNSMARLKCLYVYVGRYVETLLRHFNKVFI